MSIDRLSVSTLAAGQFLLTRREDADRLAQIGITGLPYVRVVRALNGGVLVGDRWCASALCAAAYIIAKWW